MALFGSGVGHIGQGHIHGAGADRHAKHPLVPDVRDLMVSVHQIADGALKALRRNLAGLAQLLHGAPVQGLSHMVHHDGIRRENQIIGDFLVGAHGEDHGAGLHHIQGKEGLVGLGHGDQGIRVRRLRRGLADHDVPLHHILHIRCEFLRRRTVDVVNPELCDIKHLGDGFRLGVSLLSRAVQADADLLLSLEEIL